MFWKYILISTNEYALHKKNKSLKYVLKLQYEIEIQCEDINKDEESLEEEIMIIIQVLMIRL